MAQILVVDDDAILREGLAGLLEEEGYRVLQASSGTEALGILPGLDAQCILMDVRMPGMDGLAVLKAMRQDPACPPVVVMTAYGTTATAIEAMKLGAFDYVLKPFDIPALLGVVERAAAAGARPKAREGDPSLLASPDGQQLVGSSTPMQEIYKAIGRVAPTDALVLVRGESGTGKELVARSIWKNSARSDGPFAVVNCVAIPDTLLESELFGYEKGSFTGAQQAKPGRIEQAAGGTVFLDEIGDMPLNVQAKFLRLLQERQIERIGAPNPVPVDVRIVAATNVDLERAVREGRFREDLYYRLKVVTLWLPPLRERLGDVPELARALLARQAAALGVPNPGIAGEALDCLQGLSWPGNVRELANLLQKALVFSDGSPICRGDVLRAREGERPEAPAAGLGGGGLEQAPVQHAAVPAEGPPICASPADTGGAAASGIGRAGADRAAGALEAMADAVLAERPGSAFDACMDAMGRAVVKRALELCQGNRSQAARLLGLSRPTLLARMERYGLKVETRIS